jgi:hypothetical protein
MSIEKRLNHAGFAQGATWGTSVNCAAAGCGLTPLNPGGLKLAMPPIEVDDVASAYETDIDFANINPLDKTLDFRYMYDGLENQLLALFFGTAGDPVQQASTAAYLHTFALKDTVAGLFGCYATEVGSKIHTLPSVKVMKMTLTLDNGMLKMSFATRADTVTDSDATVTTFASITYPAKHHRAKFHQGVFRMNAQSGADFAAGDVIKPKGFTLEATRTFDSEHTSGSKTIVEPLETGKVNVKLTMDFPRMDATNAAYFAAWIAATEQKADLTFTGPLIATTYYRYLKFQLPRLIVEDVEYADSNVVPAKIALRSVLADAAPTGMTGITLPLTALLMNTRTTDYLA